MKTTINRIAHSVVGTALSKEERKDLASNLEKIKKELFYELNRIGFINLYDDEELAIQSIIDNSEDDIDYNSVHEDILCSISISMSDYEEDNNSELGIIIREYNSVWDTGLAVEDYYYVVTLFDSKL